SNIGWGFKFPVVISPANIRTYLKFYNIFQHINVTVFLTPIFNFNLLRSRGYELFLVILFSSYEIFLSVLLSAYIFSETVITAWSAKYNIWCEPLRSTLSYNGRRMAIASYLFHVSKYIDLLDTFFMVVRGNKHQLLLSLVAWNLDPSVSVVETTPDPNADHSILLHVHSHDVWLLQRLPPTHAPRQDSSYLPGCPYRSLHQLLYSNLLEGQSEQFWKNSSLASVPNHCQYY
ncbi:Elongation of very long chain fatty acids protein 5, partial [Armadillidium vulgare]